MSYLYGKLDATRPYGLKDLSVYSRGPIPEPPAEVNYYDGLSLPIDGNDQYGDCVMAATAHLIGAWDSEVSQSDPVPEGQVVVDEYFKLTGGEDSGLNEASVLQTWHQDGLFGGKIAGYAPVRVTDITGIHQAIAFYGGALFGIQCPDSAQQQFGMGLPWTVVPGATVEGGHAIAPLGYDSRYVYCATWGSVVAVSYPFISKYLDECWAIIPQQFIEAGKGPDLDLASLQADLNRL